MPTDTADNGCIRFLVDGDLTFFYEREKSNLPMTVNLRCDKKSQYRLLKRAILSIWNNPTIFCEVSNRFVGKHMGHKNE